ncbi:MAG: homocysteine S-methyltransferase family protein [Candidatus Krumholzibacteria bacterium]|nr:homocysteine S-methyltransferase family protein [Candidatus Krumholzibacteria bacterium]MDH4336149.1 homocysteine S-methyltransferase family protein [Candidatus Krumholzibacteria bacterium]MDH5268790.1 homocysteine S-methyltransferase family protein [Candidatus Krumholzibacteria bacterium]
MESFGIMRRLAEGRLLFDGGMGSMLIGLGLPAGWPPEEWNVSRPEAVTRVHRAYLDAGAEVVGTNTFGATPARLATHGLADRTAEFSTAGLQLARKAVAETSRGADNRRRFVAFSLGPGGEMLPPVGSADPDRVRREFLGPLRSAGGGDAPDLILIETMIDLREALIALEVAKNTVDVPVAVSLTYNRNPRGFFTIMGDEASKAAKQLEAAGADVIGANCSITSGDMLNLAAVLRSSTTVPLLCQPNAGNPAIRAGGPVYEQAPEEFAEHVQGLFDAGVNAVGGCCGTTPDFIRRASDAIRHRPGDSHG